MGEVPSPNMEDYLERMYRLIEQKGFARVVDIADALDIRPSSVTHMLQRLDDKGYVSYEKYRGVTLTDTGRQIGRDMVERHRDLTRLLRILGVSDEDIIFEDVEGIEHHLSKQSMERIRRFVGFVIDNPGWWRRYTDETHDDSGAT